MLARSAMPNNIKRNSLVQEVIRILRNTRRDLPWSEKAAILSEFSHSMWCSGYTEQFSLEIIQAGVIGFERQYIAADNGGAPIHWPWSYRREEKDKKKLMTKASWYRPYDTTVFLPSTPDGILAKLIKPIIDRNASKINMSVKIVQNGGISLAKQLVKTDLSGCLIPQCFACKCDIPGAYHNRSGNAYNVKCKLCLEKGIDASYEGETGDNLAWRQVLHERSGKF